MSMSLDQEQKSHATNQLEPSTSLWLSVRSVWDLLLIGVLTASHISLNYVTTTGLLTVVRVVIAVLILLFGSGYLLSVLFFPRRHQLLGFERIILSIMLSIAQIIFICLALYVLEIPITHGTFILWQVISCMLLLIIAIACRARLHFGMQYVPWFGSPIHVGSQVIKNRSKWDRLTMLLIGAFTVFGLGAIGYRTVMVTSGEDYTEFAVVNPSSGRADVPLVVDGDTFHLTVTVTNWERQSRSYVLRAFGDNGYTITTPIGSLNHGSTWTGSIEVPVQPSGKLHYMQLELFVEHVQAQPYRELHLWLK